MLMTYEIYGDKLNFTKNDINIFFNKYIKNLITPNNQLNVNDLGHIILYLNNYISKEQMQDFFNSKYSGLQHTKMEMELNNNQVYIITDSFYNLFSSEYSKESQILDNDIIDIKTHSRYNTSLIDNWHRYDNNTLQEIIDYIIRKNLKIYNIQPTTNNLKIINNDIYFKNKKLLDILINPDSSKNFRYLNSHLYNILIYTIHKQELLTAQNMIIKSFNKNIGTFEFIKDKHNNNKIKIKLNLTLEQIRDKLLSTYGNFNYTKTVSHSLFSIIQQLNIIKIEIPNYQDIKINIDNIMLNQETSEFLSKL